MPEMTALPSVIANQESKSQHRLTKYHTGIQLNFGNKSALDLLEENVSRIAAGQTNQGKLIAEFTRQASAISYLLQATSV